MGKRTATKPYRCVPACPASQIAEQLFFRERTPPVRTSACGELSRAAQGVTTLAGCSKSSSNKAAGESKPEAYPQGYVEDFDEPRTQLAGFFSILPLDVWNLPINRRQISALKALVDAREAPASEKLSGRQG
jgi:hypothetical protein